MFEMAYEKAARVVFVAFREFRCGISERPGPVRIEESGEGRDTVPKSK